MHKFCILFLVASCGGGSGKPMVDAATDAPPVTLDCASYCTTVQQNCTGGNAQYADSAHCMATCSSFGVGALTDTSGNTLGCRLHYAVGAAQKAATAADCAYAGPAGDLLTAATPAFCSGGNPCLSFCALDIQACGAVKAPLPGNPRSPDGNPLFQYQDTNDCLRICPTYDRTHAYSAGASPPPSTGNSLACRLRQATTAAISLQNAMDSCASTGMPPLDQCAGAPAP